MDNPDIVLIDHCVGTSTYSGIFFLTDFEIAGAFCQPVSTAQPGL